MAGGILVNIGDEFIFEFNYPITHVKSVDSIDLTGIVKASAASQYTVEFIYSTDLLNYSDWQPFTNGNLQKIQIKETYDLDMKFRVRKTSSDTHLISVNYIKVVVEFGSEVDVLDGTVFDILDQEDYKFYSNWCKNVLRKMYEPGIVPIYIERGDGVTDRDYIDFWRTVSCYWGLFVIYVRRFESLDKLDILERILQSKGIYYNQDFTATQLKEVVKTTWSVFESRGTNSSLHSAAKAYVQNNEVQGLFSYDPTKCGEIFHYSPSRIQGLVLGKTSYLSRYIYDQEELSLLNINSATSWFIDCVRNFNTNIISMVDGSSINSGFLKINNSLDYELTFFCNTIAPITSMLSDIKQYNNSDTEVPFIQQPEVVVSAPRAGNWYFVRVIIFGRNSTYSEETSLHLGRNGKMSQSGCRLKINLQATASLSIRDLDFKILNTQYYKSSIQGTKLVDFFIKNNSEGRNPETILNEYLTNQDTVVLINELE